MKLFQLIIYFFIVYLSSTITVFSQQKADSLAFLLKTSKKDSNYIRTTEKYIWYLINPIDDELKADSLLNAAQKLSNSIKDYEGYARLLWYSGLIKIRKAQPNEALGYFKNVEDLIHKHNLSKDLLQKVYSGYGLYFDYVNQFEKSLKYYFKATELTEKYNLTEFITQAYVGISTIYSSNDSSKAMSLIPKISKVAYLDTDLTGRFLGEHQISSLYLDKNMFSEAEKHLKQSEFFAKKYCRKSIIINCWVSYAQLYINLNRLNEAYVYLRKAEKLAETSNVNARKLQVYGGLGNYFYIKKDYTEAERYFLKMLETSKKDNFGLAIKEVYEVLSRISLLKKDYQKAFDYLSKSDAVEDSLFSKNLTIKINNLEKEKQESSIKLLKLANQNSIFQRNFILLSGILIFFLAVSIIINRGKYKRLELQQKLRNKIAADLHDEIGSTLSSISILSEMVAFQQKKGLFKPEVMQQVSEDARDVIDKMDDIIWTINPENDLFKNIETRLKTFAIPLFESKDINFEFLFSKDLESLSVEMSKRRDVYLILKEAINNLVKYSQCTKVYIEANILNDNIIFKVQDNGVGFETANISNRNGLKNIIMRAKKINADLKINSSTGNGTAIELSISL